LHSIDVLTKSELDKRICGSGQQMNPYLDNGWKINEENSNSNYAV